MGLRRVHRPRRGDRGLVRRRPAGGRGRRRAPARRLAQGRGQLHQVAPAGRVDRQDRRPRHRGQLLGLGALAEEPARARVLALRRRARGKIVQLVHLSDIAWHAGNWGTNTQSVGIEHEGFTYGPGGFTDAQYHASARLAGWIARRSLMPIDRRHLIGHHDVPDGRRRPRRRQRTTPTPARTGTGTATSGSSAATRASSG